MTLSTMDQRWYSTHSSTEYALCRMFTLLNAQRYSYITQCAVGYTCAAFILILKHLVCEISKLDGPSARAGACGTSKSAWKLRSPQE